MKKQTTFLKTAVCTIATGVFLFCSGNVIAQESVTEAAASAAAEEGKWQKAGQEIKEAAGAVGEASKETADESWKATKEKSKEVWQATKEKTAETMDKVGKESSEAWDATKKKSAEVAEKTKAESKEILEKTKSKIHEATAPETEVAAPAAKSAE